MLQRDNYMKKHKQMLLSFLFMLLFVQSAMYFSGFQLPARPQNNICQTVRPFGAEEKKVSLTAFTAARDIQTPWIKEKRGNSFLTDFAQQPLYEESCAEERKFFGGKIWLCFCRQAKQILPDSLRAPPAADYASNISKIQAVKECSYEQFREK